MSARWPVGHQLRCVVISFVPMDIYSSVRFGLAGVEIDDTTDTDTEPELEYRLEHSLKLGRIAATRKVRAKKLALSELAHVRLPPALKAISKLTALGK